MEDGHDWGTGLISLLSAPEDGLAQRRQGKNPIPVPPSATDVRVEDLGNGQVRITLDLHWAVALLVLDQLAQIPEHRTH